MVPTKMVPIRRDIILWQVFITRANYYIICKVQEECRLIGLFDGND